MSELLDLEAIRQRLTSLPLDTYQAGDTVLADGSTTGKVLVLKEGAVEVVQDGVQLGKITEPGAIFGELSALLGEPHTADVRALEPTTFHVGEAASLLRADADTALYVATIMARRLVGSNSALVEVKKQVEAGQPRSAIGRMLDRIIQGCAPADDARIYQYYGYGLWI
jgi:CRP/FNR family transcriptional regulator, cyclic AMP receptor protein